MILTQRLEIAPFTEAQARDFFELTEDEGFNAHPITVYRQASPETAKQWIRENNALREKAGLGKFGIWERQSSELIGMGGLTPWILEGEDLVDLTYRFKQSAWGRGYGTESATALLDYGFKALGLPEITATITPDNEGSIKVATRLGMRFDRRIVLKGVQTDLYRLPKEALTSPQENNTRGNPS